jgi:hypothetical protein
VRRILALLAASTLVTSAQASQTPSKAFARFTSFDYVLTFVTPPGLYYCALPDDWEGSDHGTVLFFERPRAYMGVGFPSSARNYTPEVPHISLYYGYHMEESPLERCKRIAGYTRMMGKIRSVCAERDGKFEIRGVSTLYDVNGKADGEIGLSLVTTLARLRQDFATFARVAGALRNCRTSLADDKGKREYWGRSPACRDGNFY